MADIRSYPVQPRGLKRPEAARYIGIGVTKFDELVTDGSMPQPRIIGARKVWDVRELDAAFDDLAHASNDNPHNEWDKALGIE